MTETPPIVSDINTKAEECAICSEEFNKNEVGLHFLQCFHKFHSPCISKWLTIKPQCPVCKFPVNIEVVGVDEDGKFIAATGHTINNGIIEHNGNPFIGTNNPPINRMEALAILSELLEPLNRNGNRNDEFIEDDNNLINANLTNNYVPLTNNEERDDDVEIEEFGFNINNFTEQILRQAFERAFGQNANIYGTEVSLDAIPNPFDVDSDSDSDSDNDSIQL